MCPIAFKTAPPTERRGVLLRHAPAQETHGVGTTYVEVYACALTRITSVGLGGFLFSFSILYPVCLLNVILVLGVRVRVRVTVRVTDPPTIFPIYSGVKFIFPSIRTRSNSVYRLTNEITPVSAVCCPWIPLLFMCLPSAIVRGMMRSVPD